LTPEFSSSRWTKFGEHLNETQDSPSDRRRKGSQVTTIIVTVGGGKAPGAAAGFDGEENVDILLFLDFGRQQPDRAVPLSVRLIRDWTQECVGGDLLHDDGD